MKFKHKTPFLFLIFFAFFFFLFWCSPYTRDDYTFLSLNFSGSKDFFSYVFHYGNGRLLGNISGMALVHHQVISCCIRALILSGIIFLVPTILGYKRDDAYVLSFIVFTFFDPVLFGQVYLWSSAFYNYVPSLLFTLLSLYLVTQYSSSTRFRPIICLCTLLMGIASQLFIEPSTISNIFFAVSVTGLLLYFRRKNYLFPVIFWLLGTLVGAFLMYIIPILFYVEGNPTETYRNVNAQSIVSLIISCCKNTLKIGSFFSGMNSLPICLGAITTVYLTRANRNENKQKLLMNSTAIISCILIIIGFVSTDVWGGELAIVQHTLELLLVLTLVLLWFVAGFRITSLRTRGAVLLLILMALASLAPLLIVSPLPKRTIFQGFFLFGIAAIVSVLELIKTLSDSVYVKYRNALSAVAFCFIFVLSFTFVSVKSMVNLREEHIASEMSKGASRIEVFQIPYKYLSLDSTWSFDLYYYHENPNDIEFASIDYSQWMNDYYSR